MPVTLTIAYILYIADNLWREISRSEKRGSRKASSHDRKSSILVAMYPFLVLCSPLLLLLGSGSNITSLVRWVGLAIMLAGVAVHILAQRTLGQFYTGTLYIMGAHPLIQTGLYKYIRHPGYAGVLLMSVGFGLASADWYVLLALVGAFIIVYWYRMYVEEKMLFDEFGANYSQYTKGTRRLIPYLL